MELENYTVDHKKEPSYYCPYLCQHQRILMPFLLLI